MTDPGFWQIWLIGYPVLPWAGCPRAAWLVDLLDLPEVKGSMASDLRLVTCVGRYYRPKHDPSVWKCLSVNESQAQITLQQQDELRQISVLEFSTNWEPVLENKNE